MEHNQRDWFSLLASSMYIYRVILYPYDYYISYDSYLLLLKSPLSFMYINEK